MAGEGNSAVRLAVFLSILADALSHPHLLSRGGALQQLLDDVISKHVLYQRREPGLGFEGNFTNLRAINNLMAIKVDLSGDFASA